MITGGCHCGAVRYRLEEAPQWSMVCHCRTCQRISGAPFVAWITVPLSKAAFSGEARRFYGSSPGVTRSFCSHCGTPLTYAVEKDSALIDIATATLDDPGQFPPTHHSWLSHNIAWVKSGDGLPHFPESRVAGDSS